MYFKYIFFLLFISLTQPAIAQIQRISGFVFDIDTNTPISEVTVVVPKSTIGTRTDVNGEFSLSFPEGAKSLSVFCKGYKQRIVKVKKSNIIVFFLQKRGRKINRVSENEKDKEFYELGKQAFKQRNYPMADKFFSAALAIHEDECYNDALFYRGITKYLRGVINENLREKYYNDALKNYDMVLDCGYDNKDEMAIAHASKAKINFLLGNDDIGLVDVYKSFEYNIHNETANFLMGKWKTKNEDYRGAISYFSIAIEHGIMEIDKYYAERGYAYDKLKNLSEAKKNYEKALEINLHNNRQCAT